MVGVLTESVRGAGTIVSLESKTKTLASVMCEQQHRQESDDGRSWLLFWSGKFDEM